MMRLWPALLVPPIAFLAVLTAAYALVPWACETQRHFPLHLVSLACLAITGGGMALAWRDWRAAGVEEPDDSPGQAARDRFIAVLGLMLSCLMMLVTLMLWTTTFIIPPCVR
jgi:hypothetical protein